jgi:hypothetical protein
MQWPWDFSKWVLKKLMFGVLPKYKVFIKTADILIINNVGEQHGNYLSWTTRLREISRKYSWDHSNAT